MKSKKKIKFSKALEELENILDALQNEEVDIDELSTKLKRATYLIKICKEKIYETELEVKDILKDFSKKDIEEDREESENI